MQKNYRLHLKINDLNIASISDDYAVDILQPVLYLQLHGQGQGHLIGFQM